MVTLRVFKSLSTQGRNEGRNDQGNSREYSPGITGNDRPAQYVLFTCVCIIASFKECNKFVHS